MQLDVTSRNVEVLLFTNSQGTGYGHWAWIDPWGWSWVDDEPWGFAPFHYGRWAQFGGRWGWVPCPMRETPVYAPALVAWIGGGTGFSLSASFGGGPAVGWFPLGLVRRRRRLRSKGVRSGTDEFPSLKMGSGAPYVSQTDRSQSTTRQREDR